MPSQLIIVPNIFSAQKDLITRIRDVKADDPLHPITILLPTVGVLQDLQRELGDTMGVHVYQFYRLGHTILDEAGIPVHEITDTAVRHLIRGILRGLKDEGKLTSFTPVCEKPGFVEVLLDWLREMKSQGIFPEDYHAYARGNGIDQDGQLAQFYLRYQTFMQENNYSDPDGLMWVTAEALEERPELFYKDGPLYVMGFDQYTPLQVRILEQLATRFDQLQIYLHWDDGRPEDSLAMTRLRRTREGLLEKMPLEIVQIPGEESSSKAITHLCNCIFESSDPQPADPEVLRLIKVPSREAEVRCALREIKKSLLSGTSPAEIAILTPNKGAYLPILRAVDSEYGLPVEIEQPLTGNPAVAAFVNLLELPGTFSWQTTFEALRSPYVRQAWLSQEQIDLLDQLSRERPVISGRDQWMFAVTPIEMDTQDAEDEDLGPPPLVATLPPETLADIEAGLEALFDHLSPPGNGTYRGYTWWLQTAIIGYFPEVESEEEVAESTPTFDLLGCCEDSPYRQRDLEALKILMGALRRLLNATETTVSEEEISWDRYRDEVIEILSVMHIPPDPLQVKVRFGRLERGRARAVNHLFVLGLSEGEFPRLASPDPFYAPSERETHPLPLIRFSPADETALWWQVLCNVRKQLVLLRPYIDENGAPWQPSPYWDAVLECFTDLEEERIPIAHQPTPEDAANKNELLLGLAQGNAQNVPQPLIESWKYVLQAERVVRQRQSYRSPENYEGILRAPSLKEELDQRYGESHIWSASRLNRYANCPYGFCVQYVLSLEALPDPEEGLNALQHGSILHAILERLFKHLTEKGITPINPNLEQILRILDESCLEVFPTAPQRYGFRPGTLWHYEQKEISRLLQSLLTWECEQNGETALFSPYLQEVRFGIGEEGPQPLEVEGDQARFRLWGVIDRLDQDAQGNLRVIDYKSGSTTYSKNDIQMGLALQTALYALAAEGNWTEGDGRVIESSFWHIASRKTSGKLSFSGSVHQDENTEAVIQRAAWSVAQVRSGIFPSVPGKGGLRCTHTCDFAPICRVSRQSIVKARQGGLV